MRLYGLVAAAALVASWVAKAEDAEAHQIGVSSGDYRLMGSEVVAGLVFARGEVVGLVAELDGDRDEQLSEAELAAGAALLERTFAQKIAVKAAEVECPASFESAKLVEEDGLAVGVRFACPPEAAAVSVDARFVDALPHGHRHIVHAEGGGSAIDVVVFKGSSTFSIARTGAAAEGPSLGAGELFVWGIEHILLGFDHLVFLLGLVVIGGRLRSMLVVVTAFTVAHSITLGLAALGLWTPSPSIVEPAIALSIVYVGIENFFVKSVEGRWRITLPFGLIHGFGFAGALSEVGLPSDRVIPALLSFNLGVEAGQVAVLAAVLPLIAFARSRPWFVTGGVRFANVLIVVLGGWWFFDRVFG